MKVAFYTLGCKVNQYETDLMKQQFTNKGYKIVEFDDIKSIADVYVVNSCSVTNLSTRKTRNYLSRAKKYNPNSIIVLAGCYALELKNENGISDNIKADIIIGNEEKGNILKYIDEYLEKNKISDINKKDKLYNISDIDKVKKYSLSTKYINPTQIRESIKIEDGCNAFCSYCIIPYVRGRIRSRDFQDVINEVKKIAKDGVKEVVLVGIEIASYGIDLDEDVSLINLVEEVSKVEEIYRIRLGSIEPRWLSDENIKKLAKVDKLCHHFHVSVQSLDNNVLKAMNRKYTREFVFERIERVREYIKDVAFTCDIIVGFPGETDEEFNNTYEGLDKIGFSQIHVFKYSRRKGTKAYDMEGQVDASIASKRSQLLTELSEKLKAEYISKYIGKKVEVLFESYYKGYLEGYTSDYIKIRVKGDKKLWGSLQEVELLCQEKNSVSGAMITKKI